MKADLDGKLIQLVSTLKDVIYEIDELHMNVDEVYTNKYADLRPGMYRIVDNIMCVLIKEQLRLLEAIPSKTHKDLARIEHLSKWLDG